MKRLGKELLIYCIVLIALALQMHFDKWMSQPMEHLANIRSSRFGVWHPLYFTFLVYVFLYIVRALYSYIRNLFKQNTDSK